MKIRQTPLVKITKQVKDDVYDQVVDCLQKGDEWGLKQIWAEFDADCHSVLWPMFNSEQRRAMKDYGL